MKFLVLAACVAAAAGQGFFGLQAHPNGAVTPLDEPAVAAARADHLATKFGTPALYNNGYLGYNNHYGYAAGYGYGAYAPSFYGLQAHPNGAVTPLDEPAVAAARAEHLAAKADAYAVAAPVAVAAAPAVAYAAAPAVAYAAAPAVAYNAAPAVAQVAYTAAAPVAVAAAPAIAEVAYAANIAAAPYAGPLHLPTLVSHPNGAVTPADEPAVVAARANHLANFAGVYGGVYAGVPAAVGYAAGYPTGLVAHPNGAVVPVDEPAVAAARADHLAALGQVVY